MNELDDDGRRLLEWLVRKLDAVDPGNPTTFVSYRDAHEQLGLELRGTTDGISLQGQGLNSLANWTEATGRPAITGIIINRGTLEPGPGYFKLFGKKTTDYAWWAEQVRLSKEFDWSPFLDPNPFGAVPPKQEQPRSQTAAASSPLPPLPETPVASDLPEPPLRVEAMTYRVLRDSEVAKKVKRLHNFECQICGHVIHLPNGTLYAEAHHIQPLGGDHKGHDVDANVLCVCPNHHAELDLGLWDIDIRALRTVPGHQVGAEYVRHHNDIVRSRWKR